MRAAALATAPDALAAAMQGQQAIAAEPWQLPAPIRVRMALHSGEATPDGSGDYPQAAALNRLNQLLTAAHRGGRSRSPPRRAWIADDPQSSVSLRDLLEPERIWQVVAPGLEAHFPLSRTLDRHEANLPMQSTTPIGGEAEIADIAAVIEDERTRLVTLTGSGGTGKTCLALAIAAEVLDAFPDGVWFVDLAPLTDPAPELPGIAGVLGVRQARSSAPLPALAIYLAAKRLLLVLGNFEQVLAAAPQLAELLAACPRLAMLGRSP